MTVTDPLLDQVTAPGAGSLAAVARELIGPYADALTPQPLPFTGGPAVTVPAGTRWPLVLLTLCADLDGTTLTAVPQVAGTDEPPITFAPWSQAGSSLAAHVPATDDAGTAAAFALTLTAHRTAPDGTVTAVSAADLPGLLRVDLVQGMAGRLMTVLLAEKARLRRCGREIAAMRKLTVARDNALDRLGGDLGCPRFADDLVWDPTRRSPTTTPLTPPGRLEDDASYRSRLTLLRGLRLPTPGWAENLLTGDPPGTGRLADVGFAGPIAVDEDPNVVHLALRLVAPGLTHGRATLLEAIRQVHLFWPTGSAAGDAAHARRMLPAVVAARDAGTRAALARWQLPPDQPVAAALARALEALDARCTLLGARPWPRVVAGQSDAGGSRFELGHGAALAAVDPAALDKVVAAATARLDPGLVPVPRSADPIGAWLLTACGMRTAEPVADGTVFVSVLPMGPLVIDLAPAAEGPLPITASARLVSTADAAHDAPLTAVVTLLAARQLTPVADVPGLLAGLQVPTVAPAVQQAMGVLGVPLAADLNGFRRQLATVSARQYVAIDLGAAGTAAAAADPGPLGDLLTAAGTAGASSVVAMITATGTLALLLGITGLPLAGSNLAARQTVLYRWQVRGLAGDGVPIDPRRGASTQIYAAGKGISVLSCVAHVRGRGNDPYEWSPAPPAGALLTLRQYEHLMNIVELATPVGVRANTWRLRQENVDVDGSGHASPLTAAAARTYRRYRTGR